jgi:hypothetical protein
MRFDGYWFAAWIELDCTGRDGVGTGEDKAGGFNPAVG